MNYLSDLNYRLEKHSLQYTGLSKRGLKGTFVSFPHCAQTASNSSLSLFDEPSLPYEDFLEDLQSLHLPGSFWKPLVE